MRRGYQQQSAEYEQFKREQDFHERERRKSEQRKYDEDLATQIKLKNHFN